jgi:endonuclease YncB( thermonuclease family)
MVRDGHMEISKYALGEGKMKRRWILFWVLCSYFVLPGSVIADERVRVNRVYDGDTILLEDGRKVRYLGINSPEFQEPFYLKAKRFNESLVLGKEIRLEFDQERSDTYHRILAYVYVGDQLANARLVKEGLAHVFLIGPSRRHNTLLLQAQAEAKQNRVGIWSARARPKDLKITNVHLADKDMPDPNAPYVRIANLSNGPVRMTGYVLSNESGQKYVFPEVRMDPGYTIIVSSAAGKDGIDDRGQMVVRWPAQSSAWEPREDTAFLTDPSGEIVDSFHYKGKRISTSSPRSKQKAP